MLDILSSMIDIKDNESLPNKEHRIKLIYKIAKMKFEGTSEDVEFEINKHLVSMSTGGIELTNCLGFQTSSL